MAIIASNRSEAVIWDRGRTVRRWKAREKQGVGRRHVKEQVWLKASKNWKT
jgi:hypothetical protein